MHFDSLICHRIHEQISNIQLNGSAKTPADLKPESILVQLPTYTVFILMNLSVVCRSRAEKDKLTEENDRD